MFCEKRSGPVGGICQTWRKIAKEVWVGDQEGPSKRKREKKTYLLTTHGTIHFDGGGGSEFVQTTKICS
jgi:hypothetical protein